MVRQIFISLNLDLGGSQEYPYIANKRSPYIVSNVPPLNGMTSYRLTLSCIACAEAETLWPEPQRLLLRGLEDYFVTVRVRCAIIFLKISRTLRLLDTLIQL